VTSILPALATSTHNIISDQPFGISHCSVLLVILILHFDGNVFRWLSPVLEKNIRHVIFITASRLIRYLEYWRGKNSSTSVLSEVSLSKGTARLGYARKSNSR
jgi:hypothetical protein